MGMWMGRGTEGSQWADVDPRGLREALAGKLQRDLRPLTRV